MTHKIQRFAVKERDILRATNLPTEEPAILRSCSAWTMQGVIHHNFSLTDRLRQMMDTHADLIERLIIS